MTSKYDLQPHRHSSESYLHPHRQGSDLMQIAWLLPVAWFYWQPALSEYARLFPNTTVFTQ